jgi:hydroxymethylpyrimidine/phosphomethylpyrimidine kinase
MQSNKSYCLSIAGYDPSGGAGVLADIKTFENAGVPACAVQTCLTFQNDAEFDAIEWYDEEWIGRQFNTLSRRLFFSHAKIGLIRDLKQLVFLIRLLKNHNPEVRIVFDPIRKASAGFEFGRKELLNETILKGLSLVTPNLDEAAILGSLTPEENCKEAAAHCPVFLKDGHGEGTLSIDRLFAGTEIIEYSSERIQGAEKHGSGCVLSSAITAYLFLGHSLEEACGLAKEHTRQFLLSDDGLLGMHHNVQVHEEISIHER